MGKKLKQTQLQQSIVGVNKNVRQRVCMSLTANVTGESKVRPSYIYIYIYSKKISVHIC